MNRNEIDLVLSQGQRVSCRMARMSSLPTAADARRLAVITPRKLGNAVKRNRVRRCFKEAFRLLPENEFSSRDVVIIISPALKTMTRVQAEGIIMDLLGRSQGR